MEKYTLRTGNIIIVTIDGLPFFEHAGVISANGIIIYVWHITPEKGIFKEDIKTFLLNRKVLDVRNTIIHEEVLNKRIDQLKNKKYDLVNFNCFDFVKLITTN